MDSACDTEDSDEDVSEESMLEDSDSSERKEDSVCDDSEAAVLVTEVAIVASASIDDIWSPLDFTSGETHGGFQQRGRVVRDRACGGGEAFGKGVRPHDGSSA